MILVSVFLLRFIITNFYNYCKYFFLKLFATIPIVNNIYAINTEKISSSGKLKVLIIDPANFVGGAELFSIDLINTIVKNHPNIDIHVAYNGNPDYKKLIDPTVDTFVFPFPRLRNTGMKGIYYLYKSICDIQKLSQKEHFHIIQTNSVRTHLTGSLALRKSKTRLIWFMHDFTAPLFLSRLLCKVPKKIFCCSHAVKQFFLEKISQSAQKKIYVFPNGISISPKITKPQNTSHTPKIGIIGRIDPWKGQKFFVMSAIEVLKTFPQAKFHIIGAPNQYNNLTVEYYKELQDIVKEHKLEDHVFLDGYKENILCEMQNLDIVVHASTEPEPFGRVLIEAMSLAKPIIATNIGGPLEIITHKKNGLLIDPKNVEQLTHAILRILQDQKFASTIGNNARTTVQKKYCLNTIVNNIVQTWIKTAST